MKQVLIAVFLGVCSIAYSQTAIIKGRVTDASNDQPLPFSNVFISNTTLGTTSDAEGNFEIRNVPLPGSYELIVSYVGYESYSQKLNISENEVALRTIRLKPSEVVLTDVEIKASRDKEWEKKMKRFVRIFMGNDDAAKECTIVNPWVVDFPKDKDPNLLLATASSPIVIENKALGYKINFVLIKFSATLSDYSINGKSFFEEMKPANDQQMADWESERERSYRNSKQFLFKSIITKHLAGNGFRLYSELPGSNGKRSNFFYREELGKSVSPCDTAQLVTAGPGKDQFTISIPRRLEIHNETEKDNSSIYRDVLHPISWIESKSGRIVVNKDGMEVNASDAVVRGSISNIRVSRIIPTDYQLAGKYVEPEIADFGFLQERIYTQTDKAYYYPGEVIWFKGYIKYNTISLKDSLSSTVYTELIGPDKKIKASKMLEIRNGSFHNEFMLPDTLQPGDYYLRCYTSLNRNFGDDRLYVKYIPVLDLRQVVDVAASDTTSRDDKFLTIKTSKEKYRAGEPIELTLAGAGNDDILPGAQISLSVTDVRQVVPISINGTVTDVFDVVDDSKASKIIYPIEYGFGFKAHYNGTTEKDRPLSVFRIFPVQHVLAQVDEGGNFRVDGLNYYDSAQFAVLPTGTRKPSATTTVLPRETPVIHLPASKPSIKVNQTTNAQRILHYKTDEVTFLEEVTVASTKLADVKTPHAIPDKVMSGKEVRASHPTNLFLALLQKFNGLRFIQMTAADDRLRWFVYLQNKNNMGTGIIKEVSVMVNGVRMYGDVESILVAIPINTVTSVELLRRDYFLGGNSASNGVLAIYTDAGADVMDAGIDRSKNILVDGYKKPAVFKSQGSTIFWGPSITLDENGKSVVTFNAGEWDTTYKVVVEGITSNGTPVRAEKLIKIVAD